MARQEYAGADRSSSIALKGVRRFAVGKRGTGQRDGSVIRIDQQVPVEFVRQPVSLCHLGKEDFLRTVRSQKIRSCICANIWA